MYAFQINVGQLAYSSNDFEGELFRLNVSCCSETLPESGCLFFKVGGQRLQNNVTNGEQSQCPQVMIFYISIANICISDDS